MTPRQKVEQPAHVTAICRNLTDLPAVLISLFNFAVQRFFRADGRLTAVFHARRAACGLFDRHGGHALCAAQNVQPQRSHECFVFDRRLAANSQGGTTYLVFES